MAEQKPQEFKAPSIFIMLIIGGVLSSIWYTIQDNIGIRFLIPYIAGFCISIGGLLYVSSKIIIGKKPFTDCKKINSDDLVNMTIILMFVGFSIAFRSPNSTEIVLLVQFILLLVNIIVSVMSIEFIVKSNRTRETVIILGLSAVYFWSGFYIYNTKLPLIISSFLISITIITIGLGVYVLGQQKDKNDIFHGDVEKLQKTRKAAKELQDKLSESDFAKTISHISDVPLTEAPPPKIAWDVDYDIRKAKENIFFAKQLKEQIEYLEKLKNQEPTSDSDSAKLLSLIDQAKKLIDNLKQQISQLEKPRLSTQKITAHSSYHHSGESIGQLQQNAPVTVEKINGLFAQMQTIVQQQKEKTQTQQKQNFEQALSKLKSDVDRLGGSAK